MSIRRLSTLASISAALVLAALGPAAAHTGAGPTSGLVAGLAHPLSGLDHVLAMVAVGMLAGLIGGRAPWLVPASFLTGLLAGGGLGLTQVALPAVEPVIIASVVVLGLAVALARPAPLALAVALAAGFGVFHGHAHAAEMPAGASALAYGLGFASATAVLHGVGLAASLAARHVPAGRMAVRAGGAAIGALGVALLLA